MSVPGVLIAGTRSGDGKTVVSCCLIAALARSGCVVQPFKVGPDYIDPGFHALAAGRNSYNLDLWMSDAAGVKRTFAEACDGADLAVVEGVMGLFDSSASGPDTSSAEIASILGLPVILVLDAGRAAQSAAATALGFNTFRKTTRLAGVILNRVGSHRHLSMLRRAFAEVDIEVLGAFRKEDVLSVPETYLGLQPVAMLPGPDLEEMAALGERSLELAAIWEIARSFTGATSYRKRRYQKVKVRLGVLRDEAFCFYYQDTFDALRRAGAELVFFSPISETRLPADLDGLYMGGGFPEAFGAELQANRNLRKEIAETVSRGLPVYAECGGLLYLLEEVEVEGRRYQMIGAVHGRGVMTKKRQALGYVTATLARDCLIGRRGQALKGHEFHWSSAVLPSGESLFSRVESTSGERRENEGFVSENIMASYVHLQLGSISGACQRFVDFCGAYRARRAANE